MQRDQGINFIAIRALRAAMEGKGVSCLPPDLRVSHLAQKAENLPMGLWTNNTLFFFFFFMIDAR